MGLIWEIIKSFSNSDNDKKSNIEKECDYIGLNEKEREEVKKGNYDPIDFEEEAEYETDYYNDDF